METEVVKNTKENGKNNVVRNTVLAGGAAVAGAGSVLGAESIMGHGVLSGQENDEHVAETTTGQETSAQAQTSSTQAQTSSAQDQTTSAQESTPNAQNDNHNAQNGSQQTTTNNTDPQPQDSNTNNNQGETTTDNANGGNANGGNDNGGGTNQGEGGSVIDNVNPDDVAQEIVEGDFIDPSDNDVPDLAITSVGTIETLDGQVFTAAQIVGGEGENLYVVDLDNDDVLDVVTASDASLVDIVGGTLTIDDAESIISQEDPNQGYLVAANETTATEGLDADIMENITNLDA